MAVARLPLVSTESSCKSLFSSHLCVFPARASPVPYAIPSRHRRNRAALGPGNRSAKPVCGSPAPVVGQRRGPVLLVDPRADRDLRGDRAASAAGCNRAAGRDVRLYAAISRPGRCCRALRGRESEKRERPCTKVVERGRSHWPRRPIPASPNAYRAGRAGGPGRPTACLPACLRRGSRPPSRGTADGISSGRTGVEHAGPGASAGRHEGAGNRAAGEPRIGTRLRPGGSPEKQTDQGAAAVRA